MTGPRPSSGLARRSSSTGPAWRSALERGRLSINEVGIELLHHWFPPQRSAPAAITGSEVLGVVPLEVTDALLDTFHRLADRHEHGYMAEHVIELLATS
jgi:hypothetical protein